MLVASIGGFFVKTAKVWLRFLFLIIGIILLNSSIDSITDVPDSSAALDTVFVGPDTLITVVYDIDSMSVLYLYSDILRLATYELVVPEAHEDTYTIIKDMWPNAELNIYSSADYVVRAGFDLRTTRVDSLVEFSKDINGRWHASFHTPEAVILSCEMNCRTFQLLSHNQSNCDASDIESMVSRYLPIMIDIMKNKAIQDAINLGILDRARNEYRNLVINTYSAVIPDLIIEVY